MSQELIDYVREQLAKGFKGSDIKDILRSRGWSHEAVEESFRVAKGHVESQMSNPPISPRTLRQSKAEVLRQVKVLAAELALTREELLEAYDEAQRAPRDRVFTQRLGVAEILYYIGGAIAFLGIAILVGQHWSELSFETRLVVTLGVGVASYVVGVIFSRNDGLETAGSAFFLVSALVSPIGLYVLFDHFGFDSSTYAVQTWMSGILFAIYLASYFLFRKNIFTLFSIVFGTWLFFALTDYIAGPSFVFDRVKFTQYQILAASIAYMFLGYALLRTAAARLSDFLYNFGVLGFLGVTMWLGGWSPHQNLFWELIYPALVFGAIFLSIHVKSRAFLTFGSLFLMGYILKLTAEYFSDNLGWPLALVIAGFALIAIGYLTLYLNKRYISRRLD